MSTQAILRSIRKGTETPVKAIVKGTIPKWVKGSLFRNGPGQFEFKNKYYQHLFDGAACVNKFEIKDGNVSFSNKLIESQFYNESLKGQGMVGQFGTVSENSNIIKRLKSFYNPPKTTDNTNVTIFPYANKHLYAMTEVNQINRLNPEDLSIMSVTDITNYFKVRTNIAHPHVLRDGSWINMGLNVTEDKKGHYVFFKYQGGEKEGNEDNLYKNGKVIASVPSSHADGSSYFHSFGITENYIIFLESPIKMIYKERFMNAIWNRPTIAAFTTDFNFPTRIHIINQHTGEVMPQKFTTIPQFTFHHINAYEKTISDDQTDLVVDICSFNTGKDGFNLHNLTYDNIHKGALQYTDKAKAVARRLEIPLKKSSKPGEEIYVNARDLSQQPFEFPTINYFRDNARPYKYFYATNSLYSKPFSVLKMNVENPEEILTFEYPAEEGRNVVPSEPIFVENPDAKSDDDGVLLVSVLDDDFDYLSVLDARNMKEIARAEFPEEARQTFTFHGFFAEKAKMF